MIQPTPALSRCVPLRTRLSRDSDSLGAVVEWEGYVRRLKPEVSIRSKLRRAYWPIGHQL
jgi:hypothetical protein